MKRVYIWHKYKYVVPFAVAVALLGTVLLTASRAATPTQNLEAESGTVSANAKALADTTTSGGHAVKFTGNVPVTCDFNATPTTFADQMGAANPGQTVCLTTGNYGTWTGTSRAITVAAAPGATPTMAIAFSGGGGFTLIGMSGMSGTVQGTVHDITIKNSTFTGGVTVILDGMQNANIVFDGDHFPAFVGTARFSANNNNNATISATPTGVVVENSVFDNPSRLTGVADGARCDGSSMQILNNDFSGIYDKPDGTGNHGDPVQIYGGTHCIIKGNYFHDMIGSASCSLGQWDGGDHNIIENNVVYTGGCFEAIGIYADDSSLVDHNTFIAPPSGCAANPQSECASVAAGAKSGSTSSGTVYRDNVMSGIGNGNGNVYATFTENHNLCTSSCGGGAGDIIGTPILVGGSTLTNWAAFKLASNSPGYGAASDGGSMGIK